MLKNNIIHMMQKINLTFTSVTGHSISFMDIDGKSVLPFNIDIFSDFCKYVINSEKGRKICLQCNNIIGYNGSTYEPRVFQCHMGLTMIAVPIIINGKSNYCITYGQMLREDMQEKFYKELYNKANELELDFGKLIEYGRKVNVVSKKNIESMKIFLIMLAEYISVAETQLELSRQYAKELETKIKLKKNLRETQFKFLQAQISPHFLFNTLNLLARVANNENANKTADLIYNLSDLLRQSYKTVQSSCTLKEEIQHTKSYLNIQQARYNYLLDIEIYLDKQIEDTFIPVFTIQPLVENAIIHGIEPLGDGGSVCINVVKDGNNAIIKISDNGVGIKKDLVDLILNGEVERSRMQVSGMGINNVVERLKLFFEEQYTFDIKSVHGRGTEVIISIPILSVRSEDLCQRY